MVVLSLTKKKGPGQNKSIGPRDKSKKEAYAAREKAREAKALACKHPRRLWRKHLSRNDRYYWECKCGAFMGFE